jgi:hypothetical protein
MKNSLNNFFDFITGGFFNYIGAGVRVLFTNRKFSSLLKDTMSNYVGMMVMGILLLALFLYIKYSV